jgi:hypothetical protein
MAKRKSAVKGADELVEAVQKSETRRGCAVAEEG